jgi:tRNA (guanine26-N2/guanine27-N2)-dimethyltransferase
MPNKKHLLDTIKEDDVIHEGCAVITYNRDVFYNPVQEFNRDLSVLVISAFVQRWGKEGVSLIECLAASGLRSIRYALEIPKLTRIITNDIDPAAIARIRANLELNHVEEDKVIHVENGSANAVMQQYCSQNQFFDVIDLDPYGSAAPFIETAIQAISDGGITTLPLTFQAFCASHARIWQSWPVLIRKHAMPSMALCH